MFPIRAGALFLAVSGAPAGVAAAPPTSSGSTSSTIPGRKIRSFARRGRTIRLPSHGLLAAEESFRGGGAFGPGRMAAPALGGAEAHRGEPPAV